MICMYSTSNSTQHLRSVYVCVICKIPSWTAIEYSCCILHLPCCWQIVETTRSGGRGKLLHYMLSETVSMILTFYNIIALKYCQKTFCLKANPTSKRYCMASNFWDNIVVNFDIALCITKILASKILVFHGRIFQLWIFHGSVEELPAFTKWKTFL